MEASLKSHIDSFVGQASEALCDAPSLTARLIVVLTHYRSVRRACLVLMVYFARHIWPGPSVMWFGSYLYAMAERCLAWRVSRSTQSLKNLPVYLAPTQSQSRTPHLAMISWISMPPLRDRIIQHYSSSQLFDKMWLDLMSHAVVEIEDISTILTGVGTGHGCLGIWNIFDAMDEPEVSDPLETHVSEEEEIFPELTQVDIVGLLRVYRMPLPDIAEVSLSPSQQQGSWEPITLEQLFTDSELARRLYYHLELYNAHKCWRIDPTFFDKYPNLQWEGCKNYTARGVSFRKQPRNVSIPSRQSLDQILFQYQLALMTMNPSKII